MNNGIAKINGCMIDGLLCYLNKGDFKGNNPNSYMTAYSEVIRMADDSKGGAEQLFQHFLKVIDTYMKERKAYISKLPEEKFVDSYLEEHRKCDILMYWMKRIFSYLDKFHTKNKGTGTLSENSMKRYNELIFKNAKQKLFKAVNELIKKDRDCNMEDKYKIKTLMKIIEQVDYRKPEISKNGDHYEWEEQFVHSQQTGSQADEKFENLREWYKIFSRETETYIKNKVSKTIHNSTAPEYINLFLQYLQEEEERKNDYIPKMFHKEINDINYNAIVREYGETVISKETGITFMLKNKRNDEIKKAYELLSKIEECKDKIIVKFEPYINERGEELYKNKDLIKDPLKFIPELIKLKQEIDNLVQFAFNNDMKFQDKKDHAFSLFMSKPIYSKQLANYTDYMMKAGLKGINDMSQISEKLEPIINLFKCLSDKLIFKGEAEKRLSDRLISKKSLSHVAETMFISKLKTQAGVSYVNKMLDMMKDFTNNKSEMDSYNSLSHRGKPNNITFAAQVVCQSAWEISTDKLEKLEIPKCLTCCMEDFNNFYMLRHKSHKLMWCYGLCNLEIKHIHLQKKFQSISSLCQYAILINLETQGKLTIEQLSLNLGYKIDLVTEAVTCLIFNPLFNQQKDPKAGVISVVNNFNESVEASTQVEINKSFNCPNIRFNTLLNYSKKKQANTDNEAINMRNYEGMLLQMNITRIMKSRIGVKTTHSWLVSETAKQIEHFRAQPQQIKEAIEKLLEKDIIKRSDQDRNCYEYVA